MSIADQIAAEAQRQGVDPSLAIEVAMNESSLNPSAIGDDGKSIGLFQLQASTAAQLGVDPYDVNQNIQGGITYLRQLLARYGEPAKALAAYNWGPTNLDSTLSAYGSNWFANIPRTTQGYITKILGNVQSAYTPAFNPTPFVWPTPVLNIPPAAAPAPAGSIWTTLAIAAAVILGLGFVLSES